MDANTQPITKNIPQDSRRAQVSLSWGKQREEGGTETRGESPADHRPGTGARAAAPGWGPFRVKNRGRWPGDAASGRAEQRSPPPGALGLDGNSGVRVRRRRRQACETVPKLLETRLQFRFRNFRDLRVCRVGWDSGKSPASRAGRADARAPFGAVVRLLTTPASRPSRPRTPRARSRGQGSHAARSPRPPLRRASARHGVRSAPAARPRRLRAPRWETAFDQGRPCLNPDPSPLPSAFRRPATLPPRPGDPAGRLACLHRASGSRFHQVGENANTGLDSAPDAGEASGGWGGRWSGYGGGRGEAVVARGMVARLSFEVGRLLLSP